MMPPEQITIEQALQMALQRRQEGNLAESEMIYRQVLEQHPDNAAAWHMLGLLAYQVGKLDIATELIGRAIELFPQMPEANCDLGIVLHTRGLLEPAIAAFRESLRLDPDRAATHWNLGTALLAQGQLLEGWPEFEWRLKLGIWPLDRGFAQPKWDGSDPAGKTILIHAEAGFGDAIQFIRFLPLLRRYNAKFIVECHDVLAPLFRSIVTVEPLVARGEALPAFDLHIPMPSLAGLLKISLENIPGAAYLAAPAQRVDYWARRIASYTKYKVGLVWAGRSGIRPSSMEFLSPLANLGDVHFFSLQKDKESPDKQEIPAGMELIDFTPELTDFAETAALIENLDLVISVDTSVAHLAGALGKPVWVLIPRQSDFRWLLDRSDSPWYGTMRLFRQQTPGDWREVMGRIGGAIRATLA
jgi:tetratricopeptide (TPR) repeat protein